MSENMRITSWIKLKLLTKTKYSYYRKSYNYQVIFTSFHFSSTFEFNFSFPLFRPRYLCKSSTLNIMESFQLSIPSLFNYSQTIKDWNLWLSGKRRAVLWMDRMSFWWKLETFLMLCLDGKYKKKKKKLILKMRIGKMREMRDGGW